MQPPVLDAIIGNVGTMIAFRMGAQDAPYLAIQLGDIAATDLLRLPNYHAYVQLMVNGQKSRAFSMMACPPAIGGSDGGATRGERPSKRQ
jgi:hypothetical protein